MAAAPQPTVGILPEEADLHTAEARVNKHKADWRGWKFMWPFAVVFVFVFIIPIVYAIYISFFKKQMVGGTKFVGFENYARLIQDPQFWSSVGRVTIFTVFQVPIMLFLAAAMALALDSMKLHGTKFFRISTFLPYAVPAVVSTMIWGFVYGAKYGLVGSLLSYSSVSACASEASSAGVPSSAGSTSFSYSPSKPSSPKSISSKSPSSLACVSLLISIL